MELSRIEKPVRELRKLLKNLPENPPPEDVHKLRTRTRRIEAVAAALEPAAPNETRRLRKILKPVRKAAGNVRDMDVLTADLLHLRQSSNSDALVRLIEHLAARRNEHAGELIEAIAGQLKPARRRLKDFADTIESVAVGKKPVRRAVAHTLDSDDGSGSAADQLIAELARWPALHSRNLHDFRLKVKELRYLLQAFPESDERLIEALGQVKDEIGFWHDWQQLGEIARKVLDPAQDRELTAQIKSAEKQKFTRALAVSNALRRRYLSASAQKRA